MYKIATLVCLFLLNPISLYPMFFFPQQQPIPASTSDSKTDSDEPSTSTNESVDTSCIYKTKIKEFKKGSLEQKLIKEYNGGYTVTVRATGIEPDQTHIGFKFNKTKKNLTIDITKLQEVLKENSMQVPQTHPTAQKSSTSKKHLLFSFLGGFGTAALCGLSWLYANNYVKLSNFKIPFRA